MQTEQQKDPRAAEPGRFGANGLLQANQDVNRAGHCVYRSNDSARTVSGWRRRLAMDCAQLTVHLGTALGDGHCDGNGPAPIIDCSTDRGALPSKAY